VSFSASAPASFSVTVSPTGLAASTTPYQGALAIFFDDGSPSQVINVTYLVNASSQVDHALGRRDSAAATSCVPRSLLLALTGSPATAGYPALVQAQVTDNCGNGQTAAYVAAQGPLGGSDIPMRSIGGGFYESSYVPPAAGSTSLTVSAASGSLIPAQSAMPLGVAPNPVLSNLPSTGAIVNAASYAGGSLAPGSIISLFGSNIVSQAAGATSVPLPTSIQGASLLVGGSAVPLFYAGNGQINAQLPFQLNAYGQTQVLLQVAVGNQLAISTSPLTILMGAVQPAIFSINASGAGQGAIQIANTSTFAAPSGSITGASASPAAIGQYVTIYCTGLGGVSNPPAAGAASLASPLSSVLVTPTVTIGGQPAPVSFAGLAPSFVGLYQVNVQIPPGVASGNAIPLVVSQNGVVSNTVTLAIQ
jgi:uncharacterized protein (TIGR03437 family)